MALLLSACGPPSAPQSTPPPAATTQPLATPAPAGTPAPVEASPPVEGAAPAEGPAPAASPAPAEGPATASGQFEVKNTSTEMPEVLVETMAMVFEVQWEQAGPWQTLGAACTFSPAAPVLVRDAQAVRYDCRLQSALPPEAELRATVEIRLFGSDRIFRLQVQQ
jgi:hypothetical protein